MIHLNYDGKQNNGIIFNTKYTNGAMFKGVEFKPTLTFAYDSFQYSEVFEGLNYVELNKVKTVMTPEQAVEIVSIATDWVQALGQEGNPNAVQKEEARVREALELLDSTDFKMTADYDQDTTDVRVLRQEARELIREIEARLDTAQLDMSRYK